MRILLPIAGISVHIWLVIAIGAAIGVLSGLLGVGGGFLLTPILMMVGVPPTVAAASGTNAIVATSSSGVAAYLRLRNVDLRMGSILLLGGVAGSGVGVRCVRLLRELGSADLVITLTYILMLSIVGGSIVLDNWRKIRRKSLVMGTKRERHHAHTLLSNLPFQMEFPRSGVRHSALLPFALCLIVGLLTAVMGVGGGFMLVPMMVYLLGMPVHVAVGTSLFTALFTCSGATLMQAIANHTVDLTLALLVAVGSTIGVQIGVYLSRRLRGEQLMILLGLLALGVVIELVLGILVPPSLPLSEAVKLHLAQPFQHYLVCLVLSLRR